MNRLLALLLPALLSFTLPGLAKDGGSFLHIREVITEWSPDRHLWINGKPGVSAERLGELETWLGLNAPNWTVVLMQSARGQSHGSRSGMDAVEFALGEGLSNETGFGQLIEPVSGEANGAVFVLFLEERKFSYFASDLYDRHDLGERHWIGRLDAPAIRAMRNGGRIVDAVKNTIISIDTALTRKLGEEVEKKRLAELNRQRAIAEAETYAIRLETRIRETESRLAAFSAAHPSVTGPLAHPDFAKWRSSIPFIGGLVSGGDLTNAGKEFVAMKTTIDTFHRVLDQWEDDLPRFNQIGESIRQHPAPAGARLVEGRLAVAADALVSARENHAIGDPLYTSQLDEAVAALGDATRHLAEWKEAEIRRKVLTKAILAIALLALTVLLLVANRMRRPAMTEAGTTFRNWKEQLRGRFDELYNLMDRTGMIVGTSRDLDERGYGGITGQLAREAIRSVDELFIMSTATDRIMDEAENLIVPRSPFARLLNVFSSRSYRHAVRVLSGEPIGFDDRAGLASILGIGGNDRQTRSLLGRIEDYEPFKLSFAELIEAYDAHQQLAQGHVNRLSAGIDGLPQIQQDLAATLGELSDRADEISLLAKEDRLFPLDALRATLLPAAGQNLDLAAELGKTDPVSSFETLLPVASRLVGETGFLLDRVARFREDDLPRIVESRHRLREIGRATTWMDEGLNTFVRRSEDIAEAAAGTGTAESLAAFDEELTRFTGRCLACIDLALRARDALSTRMSDLQEQLAKARSELGGILGLSPDDLLVEPGLSPLEKLETARCGVEVAFSAIDRGEAFAALEDLDEAERCLDDADALIRLSLEVASTHRDAISSLTMDYGKIEDHLPHTAEKLRDLEEHYAPSVLLFSAPYNDRVNGPQTILECVERARRLLAEAATHLGESESAFATGALIRSRGLLDTISDELDFARHQIALVEDHHAALKSAETAIAPLLEKFRSRHRELGVLLSDHRTCRSTLTEHERAGVGLETLFLEQASGGGDPFVRLRLTEATGETLNAVDDGIRSDWKAHALATSSATGARAALAFCIAHLREAEHDGIADSEALSGAIRRHAELSAELDQIKGSINTPHEEWTDCFNRINALTGEIGQVRSTLEAELAAAREAVVGINAASAYISELHRWRSRHSVAINREAGASGLAAAKERLATGRYANARELAIASKGAALHELQQARAAESAKVRAAEAAASHRQSFSSSSGFQSFSNSRSSSGFSRSSSSSGSGFSRSGW